MYVISLHNAVIWWFSLAPVKVNIERSSYTIKESCTLLSVTLVAVGEVREEFRVGVYAVSHYMPSAKGMEQHFTMQHGAQL